LDIPGITGRAAVMKRFCRRSGRSFIPDAKVVHQYPPGLMWLVISRIFALGWWRFIGWSSFY
jgi:hypothetical protein